MKGDKEEGERRKKRTQELWMGQRRGEPQQTASSVGTTGERHSQRGEETREQTRRGESRGEAGRVAAVGETQSEPLLCSVVAAAKISSATCMLAFVDGVGACHIAQAEV